ncbi:MULTISPECIES: GNAT family N-acetyltransferase [Staphylococcus]|uniref:GNAT family N-acetyltransferase n=1 Tax=Staphylococcus TaxID=1279 RepID=UPI0023B0DA52|nr:GNAT family N-acetyltransferase [Staphylococcus lugdunensis]
MRYLYDPYDSYVVGYLEGETFITIAVIDMRNTHFYEIKNIAVDINYQHQGLGRRLMEQIFTDYRGTTMYGGTSDSPVTQSFYRSLGFKYVETKKVFYYQL